MVTAKSISVVVPTLLRAADVRELLSNLAGQRVLPREVIIVDGADALNEETSRVVAAMARSLPFRILYLRNKRGTAVQRNAGIEAASGEFIAFIDDDIRLEPDFFEKLLEAFTRDAGSECGGITGYITNCHLNPAQSPRWQWYRRLRLFTTYEPGYYDFECGYPINRYLQPPHDSLRAVQFMGAGCAMWRRAVFAGGLRFSEFFTDFSVLEDAHFALRAGERWKLLEHGAARCIHLRSTGGRLSPRLVARKSAVNYRYVLSTSCLRGPGIMNCASGPSRSSSCSARCCTPAASFSSRPGRRRWAKRKVF